MNVAFLLNYFLFHLLQLLKSEEDASYKPVKKACTQLVDNLVEHILKYEESLSGNIIQNPVANPLCILNANK